MRKRNIQKIVRFNRKEAQDLAAKAKKACLSEAGLIRLKRIHLVSLTHLC